MPGCSSRAHLYPDHWTQGENLEDRKEHLKDLFHTFKDLTQSFLDQLLARDALRGLDPRKGKFRSFLLVLLRHSLANEAKRASAAKRGGGRIPVALETREAERGLFETAAPRQGFLPGETQRRAYRKPASPGAPNVF